MASTSNFNQFYQDLLLEMPHITAQTPNGEILLDFHLENIKPFTLDAGQEKILSTLSSLIHQSLDELKEQPMILAALNKEGRTMEEWLQETKAKLSL